jgi:hypothetical protein
VFNMMTRPGSTVAQLGATPVNSKSSQASQMHDDSAPTTVSTHSTYLLRRRSALTIWALSRQHNSPTELLNTPASERVSAADTACFGTAAGVAQVFHPSDMPAPSCMRPTGINQHNSPVLHHDHGEQQVPRQHAQPEKKAAENSHASLAVQCPS